MSTDPVVLEVLSRACRQELQMFERVTVVRDTAEGKVCYLCLGKHVIFFVSKEMDSLVEHRLPYLHIEKAITDNSTSHIFLLELGEASWAGGDRILVESHHRESLLERLGLCWQAEHMYKSFQVKKFPQAKATIGSLLPGQAGKVALMSADSLQVKPFKKYAATSSNGKEDFKHRGYSFFLREDFKSSMGLKTGTFVHDMGWEEEYDHHKVVVPPGVEITVHVDDPKTIMDLEKSSTGADDLRTVATEYKQAITQHLEQFYVTANGQYMKRMNRNNDIAAWDGWEFFIRAKDYAFACVLLRRLYIPPLCDQVQDLAVLLRCPAQRLTHEVCEVVLDECRFVADSLAATSEAKPYREVIQARLDTLQFHEDAYRWAEGQLRLVPCHKKPAAVKFVKSIVKVLINEGFCEESLGEAEVFNDIPHLVDPLLVPQEMLSDAEPLLGTDDGTGADTREMRRHAWYWRISRYLAHCVDGGIMDDRFTMATMLQAVGKGSAEADRVLKSVVEFLLHLRPRNDWSRSFSNVSIPLAQLLQAPADFDRFTFNEKVMRLLLTENYIANEWRRKAAGRERGSSYEKLLATLLTSEHTGIGLRTLICRQILETTNLRETASDANEDRAVHTLVPALVKVMQGGNLSLTSCATAALVNLSCGKASTKTLLVTEGAMKLAIRQLKVKDDDLTLYTLYLLVNLTKTPHHRSIVYREGGVPVLVDILTSGYQNLRKQRIITEVASVIGQLCNDADTRSRISHDYPVVVCLLWIFEKSQPNTKLKSKVLFALRQLCAMGHNKIKVGQQVIPTLLLEIAQAVPGRVEECLTNSILLLTSLAAVHSNAKAMNREGRFEDALESCGLQLRGEENKKHRFGPLIWERVTVLKERIREAEYASGDGGA